MAATESTQNVIFSPRVVKTPAHDQKFGTNSLDKTVYEVMQIEVHVRASWQSSEVRDCIRHYSRLQSRKRDDANWTFNSLFFNEFSTIYLA